jgi:hypothetical protein
LIVGAADAEYCGLMRTTTNDADRLLTARPNRALVPLVLADAFKNAAPVICVNVLRLCVHIEYGMGGDAVLMDVVAAEHANGVDAISAGSGKL